jgi:hypothetical protein
VGNFVQKDCGERENPDREIAGTNINEEETRTAITSRRQSVAQQTCC